jgi:hypothetical protein
VVKTCRDIIDDVEKPWFRMDLSITSFLGFARTPGFNILIRTLYFLIPVCYNSRM